MRIRAGFEITYECPEPTPMLLMLSVHPSRRRDLETPDVLANDRRSPITQYVDGFGNICSRLVLPAGRTVLSADFVVRDSGLPDPVRPEAVQAPVEDAARRGARLPARQPLLRDRPPERPGLVAVRRRRRAGRGSRPSSTIVHDRITFGYQHARADQDRLGGA